MVVRNRGRGRAAAASDASELDSQFGPVHAVLEDFVPVMGQVLVARSEVDELEEPVAAALIARQLGLRSIDYAKRKYIDPFRRPRELGPYELAAARYVTVYRGAKRYVFAALRKLRTDGMPDPSVGAFAASVALERLPHSFFCAHLLYKLGHRYEGHAVSRHILEQLGWACAASKFDDVPSLAKIQTTKCVSDLCRLCPEAKRLYGFLSKNAHLGFAGHSDFVGTVGGKNALLTTQFRFDEFARVTLSLADMFGAVWEMSQFEFLPDPEAVALAGGRAHLIQDRPFVSRAKSLLHDVVQAMPDRDSAREHSGWTSVR
ncbi:MAG: hypothetical protein JWP97_5916 [Labilithrix sp.]|nr:hypothetical protein [Labilithrix sp.]